VLVLAVTAAAFVGARLGLLGTHGRLAQAPWAVVTNCAFTATIGDPDTSVFTGEISAARRFNEPNGVRVVALDSMGTVVDRPFHLTAHC
jgi:hypothetical protein